MGGGAEADVGRPVPVAAVMDGLESGTGEIRNFVVVVAGLAEKAAEGFVLAPALVLVRLGVAARQDVRVQRRFAGAGRGSGFPG